MAMANMIEPRDRLSVMLELSTTGRDTSSCALCV